MARAIATEIIMQKDTDATHILAADHRAVEALFEEFKKASGADRKAKIAEKICTELNIHAQIEEEVFYPALQGTVDADLLKEAYVEHDGAKGLIHDILVSSSEESGLGKEGDSKFRVRSLLYRYKKTDTHTHT